MDGPDAILSRIAAWQGCDKQYWEGVAIVRDYGHLPEPQMRLLERGMTTCRQEEILLAEVARIRAEQTALLPPQTPPTGDTEEQPKPKRKPKRDDNSTAGTD